MDELTMKRSLFLSIIFISLLTLSLVLVTSGARTAAAQDTPISPEERNTVEQTIYQALHLHEGEYLVTLIYQTQVLDLTFSPDAQWARAWLVPVDSQTGETAPIEPGLAVLRKDNTSWKIFLPADEGWLETILASPDTLFSLDEKIMWTEMTNQVQLNSPKAPISGYRLPWKAGETRSLSQSVLHDKWYPSRSMHYAFDFYKPSSPRSVMWDIYAAKSGTVYLAVDDVDTCFEYHCDNQGRGNYIVLKDTTTTPTSYQLYLHLAKNSIPSSLKVIGTPVQRGQYIGVADNTGASYGNHLHFQVHTDASWFGTSVDITFDDVTINGGRPRVKNLYHNDEPYCLNNNEYHDICDNFQTNYVSGNYPCQIPDSTPPNGALTNPIGNGLQVTSTLSLTGWGEDNECGLAAGQFIANYRGEWENVSPSFLTSPFSYDFDLCNIPDGSIEVGLRLTDQALNSAVVGIRSLSKDYTCPAPPDPACIPGDNQVMLFDGDEYTGICLPFTVGDYTNLSSLENQCSSIMVGTNVQATLYINDTFTGRGETFFGNDNNLFDNRTGTNNSGALQVRYRSQSPLSPTLLSPINGLDIPLNDLITLFWETGCGGTEFQVLLTSNVKEPYTSPWQSTPYIYLEGYPEGEYTWKVRERNPTGEGPWSLPFAFNITNQAVTPPPSQPVPYTDTMETNPSNWTSSGFWHLENDSELSHSGTQSWWYQDSDGDYANSQPNSGDLTSPPFSISTAGHYYLRFYYRYTTESQGPYWDQRWVQISVDGGPFEQADQSGIRRQLTDDPFADELNNPYLSSQVFDLGVFVPGQVIRIRFHFDTLDAFINAFQGWAIDDVGITTIPSDVPGDPNEPNNTPQQSTPITHGSLTGGLINPGGDFDYFQFDAVAGDRIVADIDAENLGSSLDPYLFLIDSDGISVLAQNDDEVYAQNRDSFISFNAPHAGTYYLKLRAWNNPRANGSQNYYVLRLYIDNADPILNFTNPANSAGYINNQVVSLTVFGEDASSGISKVEFYYHDSDWENHNWELLGIDSNGADGWNIPFNLPDQSNIALYVKVFDWSRNITGKGYWDLSVDRSMPETSLLPLDTTQTSTAFRLEWNSEDNLSGIQIHDLLWDIDNGGWFNYPLHLSGYTKSIWVVGAANHSYAFRMRGIDWAGNAEPYPATVETSTFIPAEVCSSPDNWEMDNSASTANVISEDEIQIHNFCNPLDEDGLDDEDWVKYTVQAGKRYLIQTSPMTENAAPVISIYTDNGITLTLRTESSQVLWGQRSFVDWTATANEVLYIRIRHTDGRVAGNSVTYELIATGNYPVFLPVVSRRP